MMLASRPASASGASFPVAIPCPTKILTVPAPWPSSLRLGT